MLDDMESEMKQTFLDEAQSLLDEAETAFLALDEGNRSPELVDKIFRLAHNLKSSAKTVGFENLSHFAHGFEDLLTQIKSGAIVPDKAVCTLLLKTLDHFKTFIAGIKADPNYDHDVSAISAEIKELASRPAAAVVSPAPEVPSPVIAEATSTVEAAIAAAPVSQEIPAAAPAAPTNAVAASAPAKEEENLKVSRKKLDALLNLMGELVVNQSIMGDHRTHDTLQSEHSAQTLRYMDKLVHDLQDIAMSLRMVPVSPLFGKMKRIARDASQNLGKTIVMSLEGEHVEIDKTVIEKISDPLTHLVRNAVDHGLETDVERETAGKSGSGEIMLKAQQREDRVLISLTDNGRGMNPQKLIAKAREKGLIGAEQKLTDTEAYSLIFKPGFSTKEQVSDMSGRGVGMDVVQRAVDDLKGNIEIQTELGKGTTFQISLPLSLSILTGMVIGVEDKKYVIPVTNLLETIEFRKFRVESTTGKGRMINLRGEVIPVYSLANLLNPLLPPAEEVSAFHSPGVITTHRGKKLSFRIDHIFGQQQIVLKKLGPEMRGLPGVVAGAILSSGEPSLVLNLNEFVDETRLRDVA